MSLSHDPSMEGAWDGRFANAWKDPDVVAAVAVICNTLKSNGWTLSCDALVLAVGAELNWPEQDARPIVDVALWCLSMREPGIIRLTVPGPDSKIEATLRWEFCGYGAGPVHGAGCLQRVDQSGDRCVLHTERSS